jgi:hypothetical protein
MRDLTEDVTSGNEIPTTKRRLTASISNFDMTCIVISGFPYGSFLPEKCKKALLLYFDKFNITIIN